MHNCVNVLYFLILFYYVLHVLIMQLLFGKLVNDSGNNTYRKISCHSHLFSKFILDDVLIVIAYLYGIYLFSFGETEYMYQISQKVININISKF